MRRSTLQHTILLSTFVSALCAFTSLPAEATEEQHYRQCTEHGGSSWTFAYWHFDCDSPLSLEEQCEAAGAYCEFSTGISHVVNSGTDPLENDCWVTCSMGL